MLKPSKSLIHPPPARPTRVQVGAIQRGFGSNGLALQAHGVTTRELGNELTRRALLWVWRWGWTSPTIIDYLTLDGCRRGKAARLEKRGLLKAHTPGHFAPDAPRKVLVLTQFGKEELCMLHQDVDSELEGIAVRWGQLRHDYIVQCWVAQTQTGPKPMPYMSAPEIAARWMKEAGKRRKIPDAILNREAIELELNPKSERELHMAVRGLCDLRLAGHIDSVRVISTQRSVLRDYDELMQPGQRLKEYRQTPARTWHCEGHAVKALTRQEIPPLTCTLLRDTRPTWDKADGGTGVLREWVNLDL